MSEETQEEAENEGIPIDWHFPEGLIKRYANNMLVQRLENEFVISFFEIVPPPIFGSPEERRKQADKVKSVRANCVASVVVSPMKMQAFIDAMQENFDNFIADFNRKKEAANKAKVEQPPA